MEEKGKVTRLIGDIVEVTIEPGESCSKCPAHDFCRPSGNKRVIIAVNPGNVDLNDDVVVMMIRRHSLIAIFTFFGLPVILSLIGLLLGQPHSEMRSLLFGTGGFVTGLIVAKVINDILGKKHGFFPRVIAVRKKTQT